MWGSIQGFAAHIDQRGALLQPGKNNLVIINLLVLQYINVFPLVCGSGKVHRERKQRWNIQRYTIHASIPVYR